MRTTIRPFSVRSKNFAPGDYGSGAGDPKGEKPQEQGENPSKDKEHPGPPPPSAATGKQSGGDDGNSSSSSSGQAQQKSDSSNNQAKNGAQPKILSESPPQESEASEDVKTHNREMDARADRANEQIDEADEKDKVDPKFWKGHGTDKEP